MKGSALTWIWDRWQLFLGHIAILLVVVFMTFYVDGRQFLTHRLSGAHKQVFLPVQSDITTIISLLASTARLASTLWVVGLDLRCVFLFMERGGVTFDGLKCMIGGSLPGYRQFRQKRNYIIFIILQVAILASAFSSSVISGSVTWKPARKYFPGQNIKIPRGQTGDRVLATSSSTLIDSFVGYSNTIYTTFYDTSTSSSMQRLLPHGVESLPVGSGFEEITVPFFAVDAFVWVKDPISTLSVRQLNASTIVNVTGPRIMNSLKWGLIPDKSWGPSEHAFPEPLNISESRILVMSGIQLPRNPSKCELGRLGQTIPSDVQPYFERYSCFIFANVTYRAGAARCRRCRLSSPRVVRDVGDVRDLQLVDDSVTSVALAFMPYVSTSLLYIDYGDGFSTMQDSAIELLSRSYQVAWNALTWKYGLKEEGLNVSTAVDAPRASVMMWRVVLWGTLQATLVAFGFIFRHIHTIGRHPWVEDPVIAALLVDPTSLMNDPSTWAGEDAPHIAAKLKLHEQDDKKFIILERAKWPDIEKAGILETEDSDTLLTSPFISRTL